MPRAFQLVIFLAVVVLLTFGLHAYVWLRVLRDPRWPLWVGRVGLVLVVGMGVLLLSGIPLMRFLPRSVGTPMGWVVYTWLGLLFFLTLCLFALDITQWIVRPLVHAGQHPERRLFIKQISALIALTATGIIGFRGMARAMQRPHVKDIKLALPRWPALLDGLRVVQLTDLHVGPLLGKEWLVQVVAETNRLQPDLIVITGDLVDGSVASLRQHVAVLADLRAPLGVFFVTGNHEYYAGADEWVQELNRLGIQTLRNQRTRIQVQPDVGFDLMGVDDHHHGSDMKKAMTGVDPNQFLLLLAHQPAAIEEASQYGVDLQLSGHTHGGQMWPWNYLVRLQQPYVVGLHRHKQTRTWLYVSPGTGYWGPPMRVGSRCEISHITLTSGTMA